jgi:hypothetical protein
MKYDKKNLGGNDAFSCEEFVSVGTNYELGPVLKLKMRMKMKMKMRNMPEAARHAGPSLQTHVGARYQDRLACLGTSAGRI